jgi:hypothetical protein
LPCGENKGENKKCKYIRSKNAKALILFASKTVNGDEGSIPFARSIPPLDNFSTSHVASLPEEDRQSREGESALFQLR